MADRVSYALDGQVATITLDDGKANVLSLEMQSEIHAALDQAEADSAVPVLTGRDGIFSGGFDLKVLRAGGAPARQMLTGGMELAERLLRYPTPVVIACSGHALAMATFLLCSADYRVAADGEFKLGANEVAIGMVLPRAAIELTRQRVPVSHLTRMLMDAEIFDPRGAVGAGILDAVVPARSLLDEARAKATQFAALDMRAHLATKLRVRADVLTALREAIEADDADLAALL